MFKQRVSKILIDSIKKTKPEIDCNGDLYSCEIAQTKISIIDIPRPESFIGRLFWDGPKLSLDNVNVDRSGSSDFKENDKIEILNLMKDIHLQQKRDKDPSEQKYRAAISKISNAGK